MKYVVIGTAGHIDHGKSALVRALTGTDPDRLKEEKARGITIDLGFAHYEEGETTFAFVDVPGHERFIKNMLAGASGIDGVLLQGWASIVRGQAERLMLAQEAARQRGETELPATVSEDGIYLKLTPERVVSWIYE